MILLIAKVKNGEENKMEKKNLLFPRCLEKRNLLVPQENRALFIVSCVHAL